MERNVFDLRMEAGPGGEELADELARKVMAAVAAYSGPDPTKGVAIANLTAALIYNYAGKESDEQAK